MDTPHDRTARRIAKKEGTEYNRGKGPDIKSRFGTTEVETEKTVPDAMRQLRGYKGPVYIAVTGKTILEKALEATEGTTVGVKDPQGRIIKRSRRKR